MLSLCVLYVALAAVFIAILLALFVYTPAISQYLLSGTGDLSFLTPAEASHLQDVYFLVRSAMALAFIAGIILVFYNKYKGIDKEIIKDSFIMSFVFIILLIPFNYTFTWLHTAFFPQGNWQFPGDSWLITHYSPTFFLVTAITWFIGTTVLLFVFSRKKNKCL